MVKRYLECNKFGDHEFQRFYNDIVHTLLESPLAEEHKHLTRRKLDELSAQNEILRARAERSYEKLNPETKKTTARIAMVHQDFFFVRTL